MNKTILNIIIGVIIIISVGAIVVYQNKNKSASVQVPESPAQATMDSTQATSTNSTSQSFTMAQVKEHSTRTTCWSTINGNVYDLTSWVPNHPGGEEGILEICGIDGSAKFNKRHGGAPRQETILAGFKIGTLAQ